MFAMLGTIGLAGVVVNASIVMVDAVHRRLQADPPNGAADRRELIIETIVERLRPILVTTLTTLGGVIPAAYGIGGHDTVVAGMSLVLGWGLALTTVVTLFLVPTLYTLASDFKQVPLRDRFQLLRRRRARAPAWGAKAPSTQSAHPSTLQSSRESV